MRQLHPGMVARKLAQIDRSNRSPRWKRRARRRLLKDIGASHIEGTSRYNTRGGVICAKRRFPTIGAAYSALSVIAQSPNPRRREFRAYYCKWCRGWHLTSKDYEDHEDG